MAVGDADNVSRDYRVRIEFNEQGRLKRCVRNHIGWFGTTPEPLDVWHTPETLAPISTEGPGTTRGHEAPERIVIDPAFDLRPLESVPLAEIPSTRVRIAGVVDARTTGQIQRIGLRTGNAAEVTHDIYLARTVGAVVRDALVAQWQAAGHRLVDSNEDISVSARVNEFKIETPLSLWSWSAVGLVELVVELRDNRGTPRSLVKQYQSKQTKKTLLGPSKKEFEAVINACLRDVMRQMTSDAEVAGFVAGGTGRRGAEEKSGLSEEDSWSCLLQQSCSTLASYRIRPAGP